MMSFLYSAVVLLLVVLFVPSEFIAQNAADLRREADANYQKDQFEKAEELYRMSLSIERNPTTLYNLGNSLYQQGKFEEAESYFNEATQSQFESQRKADAWYNKGNSHFEQMDWQSALESYQQALLIDPNHREARNNLMFSRMMMEAMPPEQQPEPGENGNGEQQNPESIPFTEDATDGDGENGETGEDSALASEMEDADEQSSSNEDSSEDMSDQRLEQLLQIAEQEDQQSKRRMNERRSDRGQSLKDW